MKRLPALTFSPRESEEPRKQKRKKKGRTLSHSLGSLPLQTTNIVASRSFNDTRIHPSRYRPPTSSYQTYQPPTCRFTYSSVRPQTSALNRSAPIYSLFARTPELKNPLYVPGPKYDYFATGMTREGRNYVHGPKYFPSYTRFGSDPHYKSRRSIFEEPGISSPQKIGPGRYKEFEAFKTAVIREPRYTFAGSHGLKVMVPTSNFIGIAGKEFKVRFTKAIKGIVVKITLWRARKMVQSITRSTNALVCHSRFKKTLKPAKGYRVRIEDVKDHSKYAWSPQFEIRAEHLVSTVDKMPVYSTFGSDKGQFDSRKRNQVGKSFGWR